MCDTDPGEQCIVNEELNSVHCFCDTDNCNADQNCFCEAPTTTVSTSSTTQASTSKASTQASTSTTDSGASAMTSSLIIFVISVLIRIL